MTEQKLANPEPGRRDVLRSGAAYVAGGAILGFLGSVGGGFYNTIFPQQTDREIDKRYLSSLFDVSLPPPSVYAGAGNVLGKAIGIKDISGYLRFSSGTLVDFIANALSIDRNVLSDNSDTSFVYDPTEQAIFLGSPVANPVSQYIMGYKQAEHGGNAIPQINYDDSHLRWSFLFGEDDFGVYNGQRQLAGRISERTSQLVYRPIYKLVDKLEARIISPTISNGMMTNEWLTIIKRLDHGKSKTVIAGMHGNGTKSFFSDFRQNVAKLYSLTEGVGQYQVVLPVNLDHSAGLDGQRCTTGEIDWPGARLHSIAS
jgi:hypothetical protein